MEYIKIDPSKIQHYGWWINGVYYPIPEPENCSGAFIPMAQERMYEEVEARLTPCQSR